MSDEFDLRSLVREVADTSMIADPATLAKEVARRVRNADLRVALEQALPTVVQHVLSRRTPLIVPGGQVEVEAHMGNAAGASSSGASAPIRSRKVSGIREMWRRALNERLNVGPEPTAWKFLRDCDAADLAYAATLREQHARRNAERAAQLRKLAALLETHGVKTVGQLPDADLGDTLGAAA